MRNGSRFFRATVLWAGALLTIAAAHRVGTYLLQGGSWRPGNLVWEVPTWLGLVLPFAAFAGGLSVFRAFSLRSAITYAVPIAVIAYLLMAYAAPVALYRVQNSRGVDVSAQNPFGPPTPSAWKALRTQVRADPPSEFSYDVDRPFEFPPGWVTYRIHSPVVFGLFAILAALLGLQAGFLTSGLSPPARRNARWAIGLLSAVAFFLAEAAGGEWVRSDPLHSGILGAWIPLVLPLAELAILGRFDRLRRRRLHASEPPSVY